MRFNDGYPITVEAEQQRLDKKRLTYVDGSTLNLIPGGDNNPIDPQNPDQYYDFSQFTYPYIIDANGDQVLTGVDDCPASPCVVPAGNLGRNTLRVPGVATFDFSLMKNIPISQWGEGARLQFRAEFFNIFNRTNFDSPENELFDRRAGNKKSFEPVPDSDAGIIEETATTSRQIQFALKLEF